MSLLNTTFIALK